jgi:hypothetical protein
MMVASSAMCRNLVMALLSQMALAAVPEANRFPTTARPCSFAANRRRSGDEPDAYKPIRLTLSKLNVYRSYRLKSSRLLGKGKHCRVSPKNFSRRRQRCENAFGAAWKAQWRSVRRLAIKAFYTRCVV